MSHSDNMERRSLQQLFSALSLHLRSCLGLCDAAYREEAFDRLTDLSDRPLADLYYRDQTDIEKYADSVRKLEADREMLFTRIREAGIAPKIEKIRTCFDLNDNEMLLLTAVLAPAWDERFRKVYRLFQGSEEPRMDFLLSLIEPDGLERYRYSDMLEPDGKLRFFGLVGCSESDGTNEYAETFHPAPGLLSWLNGLLSLNAYAGHAEWIERFPESPEALRSEISAAADAVELAEISGEALPMVSFFGPDPELLLNAAYSLAAEMERPVLKLDIENLEPKTAEQYLRIAQRDCMLERGIIVLSGFNSRIDSGSVLSLEIGNTLQRMQAPVCFTTDREFVLPLRSSCENRLLLRIPVEGLAGVQRFAFWKSCISNLPLDGDIDDESLRTLAGQFTLNTGQIRSAVNAGLGKAVTENRDLSIADLYEGARVSSMHHLSDLAKKIKARYTLADLVLPQPQKEEIDRLIAMARNRSLVLEEWGVGKKLVSGSGLSALFTGVPGTGKTLTAQVIAGELGLDLYRVDLSTIISKYVGETEKNLERIFTEAQNSNVILFFDEADSLFGRRSEVNDANDRYANLEVGYLLQRIETYNGIVLMATNLGANLDEAFARRINFIIDFPFPDEETRLRLWQLLVPDNIEKEANIDFRPFAAAFKIAGGNIRNAVVWAIYDAARNHRPLSRLDLLNGVQREYQKMGKVLPNIRY